MEKRRWRYVNINVVLRYEKKIFSDKESVTIENEIKKETAYHNLIGFAKILIGVAVLFILIILISLLFDQLKDIHK